jgi:cytochrome c peroxidase
LSVNGKRLFIVVVLVTALVVPYAGAASANQDPSLTPTEQLGKSIFKDTSLSADGNQACESCHGPEAGWTGPLSDTNAHGAVYEGSLGNVFGNRKPPSAAYATLSPILFMDKHGTWTGGNFWDGRATGEKLGNPSADQAQGPFLNPVEQALATPADVVEKVCAGSYGSLFMEVWGEEICDSANVATAYDEIALSIAAFEGSAEVNAFSSKFDVAKLSKIERKGYALFQGKGKCKFCHTSSGQDPLFTDFTYDNLGVPMNPENPVYDSNPDFIDYGLGGFLESIGFEYESELGKVKVPTLRNVDLRPDPDFVKAYMHNGYFKTLEQVVHFYNTRDVLPTCESDLTAADAMNANCWPEAEYPATVNHDELGDLGLTAEEEAAIVAFLRTLSDGYQP